MRTPRFFGIASIAVLLMAGPAFAQDATPVPDLKPNFSPLKFMLGTWNCKTTKVAGKRGAGRTETDINTLTADGHYILTTTSSKPFDTARTRELTTQAWTGYDSTKKQWYTFGTTNFGGFGLSTSPGWKGNKMVWTDVYATDGSPLGITTVTKLSSTSLTNMSVTKGPNGTRTTADACTKLE